MSQKLQNLCVAKTKKHAYNCVEIFFCGVRLLELKVIGDDEIRITLSCEEMEIFDIDADSFGDEGRTRRLIRELLERSGRRAGFDASADGVTVRLFPRRSGGCELFVSRCSGSLRRKKRERIYSFDCADDFLVFASFLPESELAGLETLFCGGEFYIRLNGLLCERSERALEEFAQRKRGSYLWEYLKREES